MSFDHVWPAWLYLLVNDLAVYRLTQLITDDIMGKPLRTRVTRLGEPYRHQISNALGVSASGSPVRS